MGEFIRFPSLEPQPLTGEEQAFVATTLDEIGSSLDELDDLSPEQTDMYLRGVVEQSRDNRIRSIYGLDVALRSITLGALRSDRLLAYHLKAVDNDLKRISGDSEFVAGVLARALLDHRQYVSSEHLLRHPSAEKGYVIQSREEQALSSYNAARGMPTYLRNRTVYSGAKIFLLGLTSGVAPSTKRQEYLEHLQVSITQ